MSDEGESKGAAALVAAAAAVLRLKEEGATRNHAMQANHQAAEAQLRATWDIQERILAERVAVDSEAARQENRKIDLEWERAGAATTPQAMLAATQSVQAHCARVLAFKDQVVDALTEELACRDGAFVELLRTLADETDALTKVMGEDVAAQHAEHATQMEAVEAAYMQERTELMASIKAELEQLLDARSALEQRFMEQYLAACSAYEDQLEALRRREGAEYSNLKHRLDGEVAVLEAHLDSMLPVYMLHEDKLNYNYRVLLERERENKEVLLQQKRRVNRQWEALTKFKKRYAELDRRYAAENARLTDEYEHLMQASIHMKGKYLHFQAADTRQTEQLRSLKQDELHKVAQTLKTCQAELVHHLNSKTNADSHSSQQVCTSRRSCIQQHAELRNLALMEASKAALPSPAVQQASHQPHPASNSTSSCRVDSMSMRIQTAEYWGAWAKELAGEQMDISWGLLERELGKHLAVLQLRARLADEVTLLHAENQRLKDNVRAGLASSSQNGKPALQRGPESWGSRPPA